MKTRFLVLSVTAAVALAGSAFAATPLYFLNHNDLGDAGSQITTWDSYTKMGNAVTPASVELNNGQKWAAMDASSDRGDGFRLIHATTSISLNGGASFVVAAKRGAQIASNNWESIIDVMYDKLTLGIANDTGKIVVRRNASVDMSDATIAVGQSTVLSLVCQADGSYEVWADGVSVLSRGANGTMTEWDPARTEFNDQPDWATTGVAVNDWNAWWAAVMAAQPTVTAAWDWTDWYALDATTRDTYWGFTSQVPDFKTFINVGRNEPDGWTAFNGSIGDVKIFDSALSNEDRLAEVAATSQAMGLNAVPEPSSILALLSGLVGVAGVAIRRRK